MHLSIKEKCMEEKKRELTLTMMSQRGPSGYMAGEFTRIIENLDLDGRLPDFDYAKNEMLSLDDLNDREGMLMEFDLVTVIRAKGKNNPIGLRLNTTCQAENPQINDVIIVEVPEKKLNSCKTIGELRTGDKILKMNDENISSIDQALKILNDDQITRINLLILRSNKAFNSRINCLKYSKDKKPTSGFGNFVSSESNRKKTFPYLSNPMVHTAGEKIGQMVHFKQSIQEEKSKQYDEQTNEKWIIKKRSDGSRYITKKIIKKPVVTNEKKDQSIGNAEENSLVATSLIDKNQMVPRPSSSVSQSSRQEKSLRELRTRFLELKKQENSNSVVTI